MLRKRRPSHLVRQHSSSATGLWRPFGRPFAVVYSCPISFKSNSLPHFQLVEERSPTTPPKHTVCSGRLRVTGVCEHGNNVGAFDSWHRTSAGEMQ